MQAVFTIVSNNYLHFARTLLQSVARHHPESRRFCVIVDRDQSHSALLASDFESIPLGVLKLPDGDDFLFQYSILELNTAVKPWAIAWLLEQGFGSVTYIDPDIELFAPLSEVTNAFAALANIIVTPHLIAPVTDDKRPSELDIRRAGTYNFGFCSVRDCDTTRLFLTWWQGKLLRDCVVDLDRGIFVDQSWIDLVPGLFGGVHIVRHPGYNVAYWNVAQRTISGKSGRWRVNGEPLVFFHFSGFNPFQPEPFSKHQNRYKMSDLGEASRLVKGYASRLIENGAADYFKLPYGFGWFDDGTPIPDMFRSLYRVNETLRTRARQAPFAHPEIMAQSVGDANSSTLSISYAMLALLNKRPDLQTAFPLVKVDSVKAYFRWFVTEGAAYFPQSVVDSHIEAIPRWGLQGGASAEARQGRTSGIVVEPSLIPAGISRARARLRSLFLDLLGRLPESEARKSYEQRCGTTSGYLRVVFDVSRSPESRGRPHLAMRVAKALLNPSRAPSRTVSRAILAALAEPDTDTGDLYFGLYPDEPGAEDAGIWAGPRVSIPFAALPGARIVVSGSFIGELVERQTGERDCELRFRLDGELLHVATLRDSGDFEVTFDLDVNRPRCAGLMTIRASRHFVPKRLDMGEDARELSWRLKRLTIGRALVVDCKRGAVFLPPEDYFPISGFNLVGYVAAELGVGEAARSVGRAAASAGIPYSVYNVGYQTSHLQRDDSALENAVERHFDIDMICVNADQTQSTIDHMKRANQIGKIAIGYWFWEQPRLPIRYAGAFEGLTEVWVASSFVQSAVASISPLPVFKVPLAVRFTVTPGISRSKFGLPERKFLTLVMYDFHSYQYRKNPEAAIAAFRAAAGRRSDTTLVIKTINAEHYADAYAALKDSVSSLKSVIFIDQYLTRQEVFDLEACCDCFISLHRAEGFGLGLAEMMYLGKPVIGTGWSANMEFMTPMNSFPVEYELRELARPLGVYEAGQLWADANIDHAAHCLRRLLDEPKLASEIGLRAAQSIASQLSPEAIGRQYRARLSLLMRRHGITPQD